MNVFTMLVVLVVWLPFGAMAVPALFVVTVLMGVGTGSFVPLGGKSSPVQSSPYHPSSTSFIEWNGDPLLVKSLANFAVHSTLYPWWLTDTLPRVLTVQCVSGLCTSRTIGTWLGFVYTFSSFA